MLNEGHGQTQPKADIGTATQPDEKPVPSSGTDTKTEPSGTDDKSETAGTDEKTE